jgi:hypothetical protein
MGHFAGNAVVYVTYDALLDSEPLEPTEYIAIKRWVSLSEKHELQGRALALDAEHGDITLQVQAFLNRQAQIAIVGWRLYEDGKPVPFSRDKIKDLNANDELVQRALEEFTRLNPSLAGGGKRK